MIEIKKWSYVTGGDGRNKRIKETAYVNPKYIVRIYVMGDLYRLIGVDGEGLDCDEESGLKVIDAINKLEA